MNLLSILTIRFFNILLLAEWWVIPYCAGASFVINVSTDNNNRATADVKSTVNKRQGKMAESGSVLFMYDRRGKIEVPAELDEEAVLEAAIDAGCDDYLSKPVDRSALEKILGQFLGRD